MTDHARLALCVLFACLGCIALARRAPEPGALPERKLRPPPSEVSHALRDGEPMDINRASAGDLALLPGIGPSLALRIVAHRDQNGPFPSPEALLAVRGIGQKTLQKLKPFLRFDSEEVEHATQPELPLEGGDAPVPRRGQARAHVEAHVPLARP